MANTAPFRIIRFWTDYVPDAKGKLRAFDKVEYCAIGQASRTTVVARICDLNRVNPTPDPDDVASNMALGRWRYIEEAYKAWKNNNEVPLDGTPLAAWAGISAGQADVFRAAGLRTVEDVANMTDSIRSRISLPGLTVLQDLAKAFLANADKAAVAAQLAAKDAEVADLKAQMEELRQLMLQDMAERDKDIEPDGSDKPRRGRPPKVKEAA